MRYTLTVGLLVCMPRVALLAVAGVYPASASPPGTTGISFATSRFPAA